MTSKSKTELKNMNQCHPFKEKTMQQAVQTELLNNHSALVGFIDTDGIKQTIHHLKSSFPEHFFHTFAAKANTMFNVLKVIKDQGLGCEVASPGELEQSIRVGFDPSIIVYDEPAKPPALIAKVLGLGVALNIDSMQEFVVVSEYMQKQKSASVIGFRINPQIGAGSISAMSTATGTSKFGVALEDEGNREWLINAYKNNPWLTSIHTHVGSQGCSFELMVKGIAKVVALAEKINQTVGFQQITTIDIGGGLPVNFDSEEVTPSFAEYSARLEEGVPVLYDGRYKVKTEFGRSILAKNGFLAARVEYVKMAAGRVIAITHAGAHVAARTVFMPTSWPLRISAFDNKGSLKKTEILPQDIAGPCCFAGDIIGHERKLPKLERGDYVLLHDTGAYYFSNPFYYNSLPACGVYAVSKNSSGAIEFMQWRKQQTIEETLAILG